MTLYRQRALYAGHVLSGEIYVIDRGKNGRVGPVRRGKHGRLIRAPGLHIPITPRLHVVNCQAASTIPSQAY
jgi:hypothetical protein